MKRWTFDDVPDQSGRVAVVTGANTGIGFETARMLGARGATVILACRNAEKAETARARIVEAHPNAHVEVIALDLSDLQSVERFADDVGRRHDELDILINNAGVMVPPFGRTKQGFELQFGTNHLGHFALTARLLPLLERAPAPRVVVVSSTAHRIGRIALDDLSWERRSYSPWQAYGQSKLANSMFALELERRLAAAGSKVRVTAAHPGWTATDLQRTSPMARVGNPLFAMKPVDGALPTMMAATEPSAKGGTYWGPTCWFEMSGPPGRAFISKRARDAEVAARLFDASEKLTGVSFDSQGRA
jgi:NAD(P)-dependent dehydrogenase (short-subunit alcohol dehydrogenase family)